MNSKQDNAWKQINLVLFTEKSERLRVRLRGKIAECHFLKGHFELKRTRELFPNAQFLKSQSIQSSEFIKLLTITRTFRSPAD